MGYAINSIFPCCQYCCSLVYCILVGSKDKAAEADALKKIVQISNLSPILSVDYIRHLFGICGKVVDCTITDSKHFAYVEYSKPEEATTALQLNNRNVGGRPLNVEMAKSLPPKANNNLPMMMQQAVQLQQMQFQQSLLMQQTIATQQAAARAATMKSATEAAAARAAEISRKLKAEGLGGDSVEEKDAKGKSRYSFILPSFYSHLILHCLKVTLLQFYLTTNKMHHSGFGRTPADL